MWQRLLIPSDVTLTSVMRKRVLCQAFRYAFAVEAIVLLLFAVTLTNFSPQWMLDLERANWLLIISTSAIWYILCRRQREPPEVSPF
ncbi:MAG: hypothetical protein ACFFC0_02320 [Promethearchaeota archaeon]